MLPGPYIMCEHMHQTGWNILTGRARGWVSSFPSLPSPPLILIRWGTIVPINCTQAQIPVKHFVCTPGLAQQPAVPKSPKAERWELWAHCVQEWGKATTLQLLTTDQPETQWDGKQGSKNKALGKYFWSQPYLSTTNKSLQDTWLTKFCLISSELSPRALILRGSAFSYRVCDRELKNRLEATWE